MRRDRSTWPYPDALCSARGLARPDDRGGCPLVDAMGLADLDVSEAGLGKCGAEILASKRAGYASCPRCHVRPGLLIHVRVGDHVGNGEAPARLQHPGGLADDPSLVAGEVDHAIA